MKTETIPAVNNLMTHPPAPVEDTDAGGNSLLRMVTTSWDDGDPFDLRLAELLAARKIPGTFYVPIKGHHNTHRKQLAELEELDAQGFEIGAHGVSHPNLPQCDAQQLLIEVESCKEQLEDTLGKSVSMFAYPRGRHNRKVIAALKQAGYLGARTTAMMGCHLTFDPFRMPTSVHVFPHTRLDYLRNLARAWELRRAWVCATHLHRAQNWMDLAKCLFDSVLRDGGVWHLYGHSWEIDELRLWGGLQEVLDYVAKRPGVHYVSNSGVLRLGANKLAVMAPR